MMMFWNSFVRKKQSLGKDLFMLLLTVFDTLFAIQNGCKRAHSFQPNEKAIHAWPILWGSEVITTLLITAPNIQKQATVWAR